MATLKDAIEYGKMSRTPFWELFVVSGGSFLRVAENPPFEDTKTPDIDFSLDELNRFVVFYNNAHANASYSIVYRRAKTSNGSGVLGQFRFTFDDQNPQPVNAGQPVQYQQFAPNPQMDDVWKERLKLSEDRAELRMEKVLFESEKKRFEDDKKRTEDELKALEKKYLSKEEYAKNGFNKAIGVIVDSFLKNDKPDTGAGVGEVKVEELPPTPEEEIIGEIAQHIDSQKFSVNVLQDLKVGIFKIVQRINDSLKDGI